MADFAHLHLHTDYSMLDGACQIKKLGKLVAEQGMKAVAITDHGNMHGTFDFYKTMKGLDVKPIIGCEFYQAPEDRHEKSQRNPNYKGFHLLMFARDQEGYQNLCRLNALAHQEGFYYHPRIDKEVLAQHAKGLVGTTACIGSEVNFYLMQDNLERAREIIDDFVNILGRENYFLELQDHGLPEQRQCNRHLLTLAKEFDLKCIATNDAHYLTREHAKAHDVLLCIGTGKNVEDENRMRFASDEFYVKSPAEMAAVFKEVPDALTNTMLVAEMCNVTFDTKTNHYPVYEPPAGFSRQDYIWKLCCDGLLERYGVDLGVVSENDLPADQKAIVDRVKFELGIIERMGFTSYFLVVWDFINFARDSKIPVGPGRGSGAGSIVAYLLHITDIDPLRFGLLFERFLNPDRVSPPDFDIDFCERRRVEVIDYVRRTYGADRVAQICTFGTLKPKQAIKDVARVLGRSFDEGNTLTKMVPDGPKVTIQSALEESDELRKAIDREAWVREVVGFAEPLEGLSRQLGIHAAGVIIGDQPLTNLVPLARGSQEEVLTQFPGKPCESLGLLKMDFLGLKTLTIIQDTCDNIKKVHGLDFKPEDIPLDDEKCYELLRHGDTVCVFQLESGGMQNLFRRAQVAKIEEVIALIALYRPGPMQFIDEFLDRKFGRVPIEYDVPVMEEVLKETYGIMVYQEQVMQVVQRVAGFSLAQADILRRAMGKKLAEEMEKQYDRFREGCKKNGYDDRIAKTIWEKIAKFAEYGFNKSHSAAYAFLAVRTAYLKAHYPVEFMCANLTSELGKSDRIAELIHECREMGIQVLPPDVNVSDLSFTVDGGAIRFGLAAIKGCGDAAASAVLKARKSGSFESLEDLCERVGSAANKRLLESLCMCGAFDCFGHRRSQLFAVLDDVIKRVQATVRDREAGQANFFDLMMDEGESAADSLAIPLPDIPEWGLLELLDHERELLGFYVTGHPLDLFRELTDTYATHKISELAGMPDNAGVRLAGRIATLSRKISKRDGRPWAIITLEDIDSEVDCLVYSENYEEWQENITDNGLVFIEGYVNYRDGREGPQIIGNKVVAFDRAKETFTEQVHLTIRQKEVDEILLSALATVLQQHPGETKVILSLVLESGSYAFVEAGPRFRIKLSAELIEKLKRFTAQEDLVMKAVRKVPPRENRRRWESKAAS